MHFHAFMKFFLFKKVNVNCHVSLVRCHLLPVPCPVSCFMCHRSLVTNQNDHSLRPSPVNLHIIHSRLIHWRMAPKKQNKNENAKNHWKWKSSLLSRLQAQTLLWCNSTNRQHSTIQKNCLTFEPILQFWWPLRFWRTPMVWFQVKISYTPFRCFAMARANRHTDSETHRHGNSMINPAQRTKSVKNSVD